MRVGAESVDRRLVGLIVVAAPALVVAEWRAGEQMRPAQRVLGGLATRYAPTALRSWRYGSVRADACGEAWRARAWRGVVSQGVAAVGGAGF